MKSRRLALALGGYLLTHALLALNGLVAAPTFFLGTFALALLPLLLGYAAGFSSPQFIYTAVFCLFHFGAVAVEFAGLPYDDSLQFYITSWIYNPSAQTATLLSIAGAGALTIGALLRAPYIQPPAPIPITEQRAAALMGILLLFGSVLLWFTESVQAGGLGILTAPYEMYRAATSRRFLIPWSYFGMGVGLSLVAGSGQRKFQRAALVCFGAFALIALPLGLRGEVMFPTAATLVALNRSPNRRPLLKIVGATIVVLISISAFREIRSDGLANFSPSSLLAGPTDALVEMGGSLRPVVEVVNWIDAHEPFALGATYVAPFDRAIRTLLPGLEQIEATADWRIMNTVVRERHGGIGFSPIAEGYYNFGTSGVIAYMMLVGIYLGALQKGLSKRFRIYVPLLLLPVLIQIRNDFTAVPAQILAGLFIAALTVRIGRILTTPWRTTSPDPTRTIPTP